MTNTRRVRISVGLEHGEILWDIDQAFAASA
jgi:cystathionine beta-lyase/cystathionine gamma-synthase